MTREWGNMDAPGRSRGKIATRVGNRRPPGGEPRKTILWGEINDLMLLGRNGDEEDLLGGGITAL